MPSVYKLNNELRLLTDVPGESVVFGFDAYASTLASAIMGSQPQLTVGIFGSWGCGKTTLLRRIERQLQSSFGDKALTVFFDAWRYQHEEHMLIPLLETLLNGLGGGKQHWKVFGNKLGDMTKAFMAALTVKVPGIEVNVRDAIQTLEQAEESRSMYYNWLSELQTAIGTARKADSRRRIVVLIDDLDRCLPNKMIEVLESVKVMLDVTGFVFVLAVDQQIVERTVASHYGIDGRDYLKKLVQVEFRLPPLRSEDVRDYTRTLVQSLGQREDEVSVALAAVVPSVIGDNPREVKRFINSVLLGTAIMHDAGVDVSFTVQVAFMAMDFRWPGLVRILPADLTLLEQMASYTKAKVQGLKTLGAAEKTERVKTLLQNNPGLDSFLLGPVGEGLLSLQMNELNQLLFYKCLRRGCRAVHGLWRTLFFASHVRWTSFQSITGFASKYRGVFRQAA